MGTLKVTISRAIAHVLANLLFLILLPIFVVTMTVLSLYDGWFKKDNVLRK